MNAAAQSVGSSAGDGTVGKALDVLDRVAGCGRPVRFSELLGSGAYPKATLYRLLQTLTSQGMLTFDSENSTYSLGVRLVRLAHAAWSTASLAPVARTWLDGLSAQVGEAVHLAQLDTAQVLYVDKVNAHLSVEMFSQTGRVGPAYCTGVGKAMLAFLPESELSLALAQQSFHPFTPNTLTDADALRAELAIIRRDAVAYDREEHEPGIICVAMPVLSRGGRVLGAISITSTRDRRDLDGLVSLIPDLRNTVEGVETDFHAWRFPDVSRRSPDPSQQGGSHVRRHA